MTRPGPHPPRAPEALLPSAPQNGAERDAHLRAALRHAPDATTPVPPLLKARIVAAALREAQAARAAAPWHRRWIESLRHPWRLGGAGTLAAAMLAATVLWVGRDETPPVAAPEAMQERPATPAAPAGVSRTMRSTDSRDVATDAAAAAAPAAPAPPTPDSSVRPAPAAAPAQGASPAPRSADTRPAPPGARAPGQQSLGRPAPTADTSASERRAARPVPPEAEISRTDGAAGTRPSAPSATTVSGPAAAGEASERLATLAMPAGQATAGAPAARDARAEAAAVPSPFSDGAPTPAPPASPAVAASPAPARVGAAARAAATESARTSAASAMALASAPIVERWLAFAGPWQWRAPDGAAGDLPTGWLADLAAATQSRWRTAPGAGEATAREDAGVALWRTGVEQGRVTWRGGAVSVCAASGGCERAPLDAASWQALYARLGPR